MLPNHLKKDSRLMIGVYSFRISTITLIDSRFVMYIVSVYHHHHLRTRCESIGSVTTLTYIHIRFMVILDYVVFYHYYFYCIDKIESNQ